MHLYKYDHWFRKNSVFSREKGQMQKNKRINEISKIVVFDLFRKRNQKCGILISFYINCSYFSETLCHWHWKRLHEIRTVENGWRR